MPLGSLIRDRALADAPGQEVTRDEAWGVVGTLPGAEEGQPALVLCGHTDVVPAGGRTRRRRRPRRMPAKKERRRAKSLELQP